MNCCKPIYKHEANECRTAMTGMKQMLLKIMEIDDATMRKHVCEGALQLCDQLLKDGQKYE
jgi:hypothetical protein